MQQRYIHTFCLRIMKRIFLYIFFLFVSLTISYGQGKQTTGQKGFALFTITSDSVSSNPFKYIFNDKSNGNIISWHWDFGDGHTSDKASDTHEYDEPGIYNVCLTIKTINNEGEVEEAVTCKKVRVAEKGYFNLGGHVFVNQFPIEEGIAYLYEFDENNKLHLQDSSTFDTLGFYYFYQQKEGRYIVKAEAAHHLGEYASYVPTYFGNVTKWQQANIIEFDTTMWEYNINLERTSYNTSGNGLISGTIAYDTSQLSKSMASDVPIYVIDEGGRIACTYSNNEGEFVFDNLHHGDYEVHAEITGMHAVPVFQSIDGNSPQEITVNLVIKEDQIIADVPEDLFELEKNISKPYPNPAKHAVNLKIISLMDETLHIKVFDQMGRLVNLVSFHVNNNNEIVSINTGSLANGVYNIQITSDRNGFLHRRFIKK